jgi:C_GCAxxG_C_C family probable redox protein
MTLLDIMEKTKPTRAYELSYKYVGEYHNCAQGTFAGIQEVMGIGDKSDFIKALSPFDGGIQTGDVCGAYCAGVIALGLLTEKSNQLAALLRNRFLDKYGAYTCNKIQQRILGRYYKFRDPLEWKLFHENKEHKKCYEIAANAAKWTVKLILEDKE